MWSVTVRLGLEGENFPIHPGKVLDNSSIISESTLYAYFWILDYVHFPSVNDFIWYMTVKFGLDGETPDHS